METERQAAMKAPAAFLLGAVCGIIVYTVAIRWARRYKASCYLQMLHDWNYGVPKWEMTTSI